MRAYPGNVTMTRHFIADLSWLMQAMAEKHKQAMFFPFRLSWEHWSQQGRTNAQHLEPLMQSEVMQQWATALSDIIFPLQRWQGWMQQLSALLREQRQVQLDIWTTVLHLSCSLRMTVSVVNVCMLSLEVARDDHPSRSLHCGAYTKDRLLGLCRSSLAAHASAEAGPAACQVHWQLFFSRQSSNTD